MRELVVALVSSFNFIFHNHFAPKLILFLSTVISIWVNRKANYMSDEKWISMTRAGLRTLGMPDLSDQEIEHAGGVSFVPKQAAGSAVVSTGIEIKTGKKPGRPLSHQWGIIDNFLTNYSNNGEPCQFKNELYRKLYNELIGNHNLGPEPKACRD